MKKLCPIASLLLAASCLSAAADDLPAGFVRLGDVAPNIRQDMRYARDFNFTGSVVPGHERGACILTNEAAEALAVAEVSLNSQGYALVTYDCYRPVRAVQSFVRWVNGDDADAMFDVFVPGLPRRELIKLGYIASRSSHSRGSTVDVGLVRIGDPDFEPTSAGRCDGPMDVRARESSLDMGTAYDCFSPKSGADGDVSAEAKANRAILLDAMAAAGFNNYAPEWWHFTLAGEPHRNESFDFPVN